MSTIDKPPFSRRICVRSDSALSGSITAGIIRDFVIAMDDAGIPDSAPVIAHRENTTLSTTSLSVSIDDYLDNARGSISVTSQPVKEPDL